MVAVDILERVQRWTAAWKLEPLEAEDEHRLMLEDIETGMFICQVVVR